MIRTSIIARYARSLADIALENDEEQDVTANLFTYRDIFRAVPDLMESFHSPAVPRDAKERVLSEVIACHPVRVTTANFLRILLDHNRMLYFEAIVDLYLKTVNERKGIVTARVTSAVALSERETLRLRDSLERITGKNVKLAAESDPSLLGGLIIQIGSTIYDGSIRTQLDEMKQRLMAH